MYLLQITAFRSAKIWKHVEKFVIKIIISRDITWVSALSMHSAKWISALGQVTDSHLVKCPHQLTTWSSAKVYQISDFHERHLAKWRTSALS